MTVLVPNADEAERQRAARRRRPGRARAGSPSTCTWSASRRTAIAEQRRRRSSRADGNWKRRTRRLSQMSERAEDRAGRRRCSRCAVAVAVLALGPRPAAAAAGIERRRQRQAETVEARKASRRGEPDDLQLAALHRQADRSPTSKRRPASTVKYIEDVNANEEFFAQDAAAARNRASRAAAASSSSPTGWRTRCTTSATCRTSTSRRCRTSRRTSSPNLRAPDVRPEPRLLGARGRAG